MKTKSFFTKIAEFFQSFKKILDPKDMVPMTWELKMELRKYVLSRNMSLSNYITDEQLKLVSFNTAKKNINDLIERSNMSKY